MPTHNILVVGKEVCVELNAEKIKYTYKSHHNILTSLQVSSQYTYKSHHIVLTSFITIYLQVSLQYTYKSHHNILTSLQVSSQYTYKSHHNIQRSQFQV